MIYELNECVEDVDGEDEESNETDSIDNKYSKYQIPNNLTNFPFRENHMMSQVMSSADSATMRIGDETSNEQLWA